MNDSKQLWLGIDKRIPSKCISLGKYSSDDYINDPRHLCIVSARYKFCSSILREYDKVIEIGCGDGFGSIIVGDSKKELICTDINEEMLEDNRRRNGFLSNIRYEYFDFRHSPFRKIVDAAFMVDVIEHIYPDEETIFLDNIAASLSENGVLLIGTPNETAKVYASEYSVEAHVNLKNDKTLRELGLKYFHNVFLFCMNDEVVHTGFAPMAHFLWALCVRPRRNSGRDN